MIISLIVKNSGINVGKEVVQLYVSDKESSVDRPVKELKNFKKVQLNPGESKQLSFTINAADLAFWDVNTHTWKAEQGQFEVMIGSSSQDIRVSDIFQLN